MPPNKVDTLTHQCNLKRLFSKANLRNAGRRIYYTVTWSLAKDHMDKSVLLPEVRLRALLFVLLVRIGASPATKLPSLGSTA